MLMHFFRFTKHSLKGYNLYFTLKQNTDTEEDELKPSEFSINKKNYYYFPNFLKCSSDTSSDFLFQLVFKLYPYYNFDEVIIFETIGINIDIDKPIDKITEFLKQIQEGNSLIKIQNDDNTLINSANNDKNRVLHNNCIPINMDNYYDGNENVQPYDENREFYEINANDDDLTKWHFYYNPKMFYVVPINYFNNKCELDKTEFNYLGQKKLTNKQFNKIMEFTKDMISELHFKDYLKLLEDNDDFNITFRMVEEIIEKFGRPLSEKVEDFSKIKGEVQRELLGFSDIEVSLFQENNSNQYNLKKIDGYLKQILYKYKKNDEFYYYTVDIKNKYNICVNDKFKNVIDQRNIEIDPRDPKKGFDLQQDKNSRNNDDINEKLNQLAEQDYKNVVESFYKKNTNDTESILKNLGLN
jgi:hypothetical protein